MQLAIGLRLHDQTGLDSFVADVTNPHSANYHQYLTQAQANDLYNPTISEENQVEAWARSYGLTVTQTYANHVLVDVQGTVGQVEQMLDVTINDYTVQSDGKTRDFYAPANQPTIDNSVAGVVSAVVGLDNYDKITVADNGIADGQVPYYPQDFANAYDVEPLWDRGYNGAGEHIAIVLPYPPPSNTSLTTFRQTTYASVATPNEIKVDTGPVNGAANLESGVDLETASGIAPGATIDWYDFPGTVNTQFLDALNLAGTDRNDNREISNSWDLASDCPVTAYDNYITEAEAIFESNSATGHDYLFASGDNGDLCGQPDPETPREMGATPGTNYPASSPWVTAVGGTTLSLSSPESAWSGSNGGFAPLFPVPSWQKGDNFPVDKTQRGIPDVSADGDKNTGAFICDELLTTPDHCDTLGGTSVAAPLWAGILADINQYLYSKSGRYAGFINPTLYSIAANYPSDFHDPTSGSNGRDAGPGWDQVTGLGSPDAWKLAQAMGSIIGAFGSDPRVWSTSSTERYQLSPNDGTNWQPVDPNNLSLTFTPRNNCPAIITANADVYVGPTGYNPDVGIFLAGGSYGSGSIVAWKESAGNASNTPNGVAVQYAVPGGPGSPNDLTAGTQYTVTMEWKTNVPDSGPIVFGAGGGPPYSPSGLTVQCGPEDTVWSAASTHRYQLPNSDGATWQTVDSTLLQIRFTTPQNTKCGSAGDAILTANADLWNQTPNYDEDIGIILQGPGYNNQLLTWKEAGGAASYAPVPSMVHAVVPVSLGSTYTAWLVWKANTAGSSILDMGAGGNPNNASPTRLTVLCPGEAVQEGSVSMDGLPDHSNRYGLASSDGTTWVPIDSNGNLTVNLTPNNDCQGVVLAGADLWQGTPGYEMDLGVSLSGGTYGSNNLVNWKETGGLDGSYSPGATYGALPRPMFHGTAYSIELVWKTNIADSNPIFAGAGGGYPFSPTALAVLCYPVW